MAGLSKVKGSGLATGAATASLVGIDDNATSTAITIDASEKVGIATTNPLVDLQIGDTSANVSLGGTPTVNGTGRLKFINTNTQSNWQISHNDSASSTFQIAHSTATGGSTFSTPDLTIKNNGNVAVVAGNLVIGTSGKGIDFSAATPDGTGTTGSEVLDDYEEGTWTPTLGFSTAGDLSVAYSVQEGSYTKIGNLVEVHFEVITSTFTHTTAAGQFFVAGLPFTAGDDSGTTVDMRGWTKANYTSTGLQAELNTSRLYGTASGSGQSVSGLSPTDIPNAVVVGFKASATYRV